MPLDTDPSVPAPSRSATPSAPMELASLMCGCSHSRPPKVEIPAPLGEWVNRFWGDGHASLGEVVVLAYATGSLEDTEIDGFLERLGDPAPFDLRPPLETETTDERDAIHARLERFMGDPRLRRRYAALLRDLWDVFAGRWADGGRAQAEAAAAAWSARLAAGADPLDLVPEQHIARREPFPGMVRRAQRLGELRLSPTVAGHGHIVALPGVLSVAAGSAERDPAVARRRGADEIAELLRVLSDPTRLTILAQLAESPLGVGELARTLHIAQPTASVHLRRLREAGLVSAERFGSRSVYSARPGAVEDLLAQVTERVTRSMDH